MKRLHKAIISFGIVAVLASGSSSVFAKSEGANGRLISGPIVRIDRNTRTLTVREHGTGRDVQVKVPAEANVRTTQAGFRAASFDHLVVGMFIHDVLVR